MPESLLPVVPVVVAQHFGLCPVVAQPLSPVVDASRAAPSASCAAAATVAPELAARKRLRSKQPAPLLAAGPEYVDGYLVVRHPMYCKYQRLDPASRRLVSKHVSQSKYRLIEDLKQKSAADVNGQEVHVQGEDFDSAAAHFEWVFFDAVSRDPDRCPWSGAMLCLRWLNRYGHESSLTRTLPGAGLAECPLQCSRTSARMASLIRPP